MYIGKTNNLKNRWADHLRIAKGGFKKYPRKFFIIHKAIVKYGYSNFEFSCLQQCSSEDLAYKSEEYWISFYNTRDNNFGYNISVGGKGSGSGKNSPNFGLKRSLATLVKLRESHLGNKNSNFGKNVSQETRLNMSRSQKGKQLGENHANSILSWKDVDEIRKLHQVGISVSVLCKQFNTHRTNIYSIIKYKTWIKRPENEVPTQK